jgi:hypothetical protein
VKFAWSLIIVQFPAEGGVHLCGCAGEGDAITSASASRAR